MIKLYKIFQLLMSDKFQETSNDVNELAQFGTHEQFSMYNPLFGLSKNRLMVLGICSVFTLLILIIALIMAYNKIQTLSVQIEIKRENQNIIGKMINQSLIQYKQDAHYSDQDLMKLLTDYYSQQGAKSVVDFGCGKCDYILQLAKQGYDVQGYDGTPYSDNPLIKQMDLSKQTNLSRKFDFVQSFEVGEHIYSDFEDNFIYNIATHATKGIVMSWSVVGQKGFLHVNNRDNDYIIEKMEKYGWTYNKVKSNQFRNTFDNHLHRTIMIFFRANP